MLLLSAAPMALTPELILRVAVLPCRSCGAHRLIGHLESGLTALCAGCGDPEAGED